MSQVRLSIKNEHRESGKSKQRVKRTNHQSTSTLLDVPTHSDVLGDQNNEDETERGRLLVQSAKSWWTEMAKWIGDVQRAERDDSDMPVTTEDTAHGKWKPVTLATLFAGQKDKFACVPAVDQREADLMEALAEAEEDDRLDDGTVRLTLMKSMQSEFDVCTNILDLQE